MLTLPRAAGFAAALCTALALTTPAFALDVQIQEGAAVKFPKGLKWKPMAFTVVSGGPYSAYADAVALGTATKEEREKAIASWPDEVKKNDPVTSLMEIMSQQINTNDGTYFISGVYSSSIFGYKGCAFSPEAKREVEFGLEVCATKIIFTPSAPQSQPQEIPIGATCLYSGFPEKIEKTFEDGARGGFKKNHPEVAFDAKSRTLYMRGIYDGKVAKSCNRKITLTP